MNDTVEELESELQELLEKIDKIADRVYKKELDTFEGFMQSQKHTLIHKNISMQINKNIAISDSGFLFNPATGESYSLNATGTELLNLIKEGKTLDEIISIFLDKYDTDKITVEKDYQDFTEVIMQYNLSETDAK